MKQLLERTQAAEHFAQANRLVAEGQQRVDAQLALITRLRRDGHDTHAAKALLNQLEQTLSLQTTVRDRIVRELKEEQ